MMLPIMKFRTPEFVKKQKLRRLFSLTAEAFGCEMPDCAGFSYAKMLETYAMFSSGQAEMVLRDIKKKAQVEEKLYHNTYVFGQELRKQLHVKTWEQSVKALEFIYGLIGISFECDDTGRFIVSGCYFSGFYSEGVCRLIYRIDQGLAEGLSNGGILSFEHRITEGESCCGGYFRRREES